MLIDLYVVAPPAPEDLDRLLDSCRRAGLDGVCLLGAGDAPPVAAARACPAAQGLALFFGVEIQVERGRFAWIPRDPGVFESGAWSERLGLRPSADAVVSLARELGGALLTAHPYDRLAGPCFADGIFHLAGIAGVHVANAAMSDERNRMAIEAVTRLKVSAVGGTGPGAGFDRVGHAATAVLLPPAGQAALADAIARGDVWAVELLDEVPHRSDIDERDRDRRDREPGRPPAGRPGYGHERSGDRPGEPGGRRRGGRGGRRHRHGEGDRPAGDRPPRDDGGERPLRGEP
jgi:hypothetical protein